jgi:hypothetical protein
MGVATATQISGMIVSVRWTDCLIDGGYPFCTFSGLSWHTHTLDLKYGVSFRIQDFHNPRVHFFLGSHFIFFLAYLFRSTTIIIIIITPIITSNGVTFWK